MLRAIDLRTEHKVNPLGLETKVPRLSWAVISEKRCVVQRDYQIKCTSKSGFPANETCLIWDSGKVESEQSVHIGYDGEQLKSRQRVYWQVKVWDNYGEESGWSEPAFWEMGLLNKSDWKAEWIEPDIEEDVATSTPCPYLRKEFSSKGKIKEARIYITCHGLYQLTINGQKATDQLFTPGWTSYAKRLQYQVFDVTNLLNSEKNTIGIILGDGWYRGFLTWTGKKNLYGDKTALLLQMELEYEDGKKEIVITDNTWKATTGPILKSDIYNGETYDARLEKTGWDKSGFDDKTWRGVIVKTYDKNILVASEGSPVRITQTIKPIKKFVTPKGELVFDLGQNMVGWVQFKLKGAAGTKITLRHAEVLDKDGNFYTENLRAVKAEDQYIFKGEGIETYEPHFTFHGFRYVMVSDYNSDITLNDITGKVIHSDMKPIGDFTCSDTMINQLQKNIQWGLRGNFLDVPTDCPQRDERLGWTGDAQVFAPTACFNMDATSFYEKWMKDFITDQKQDGSVPWVVPMVVHGGGGTGWSDGYGAAGWADAAVIIPWEVYQAYGDKRILENQYQSMKAWVEFMRFHAGDKYIFNYGFHFGDWLAFSEYMSYRYAAPDYGYAGANTEKDLIATAYFYYSTGVLQKIATILGKEEDAGNYAALLPKIKTAFAGEFITQTGRLSSGTQTAYILALSFGLVPDTLISIVAKRLADDVTNFGHLTTGFLGTPLICQTLTQNGYPDLAYMLLFNKRYPSWLYPVTKGATTIWERWDCIKPDNSFQDAGMNSFNHYAYGAVGKWLYSFIAGLSIDPEKPGYKHIIIKPYPTKKLTFAKAEHQSVYGKIISEWRWKDSRFVLSITIPPNTTATVYLPAGSPEKVAVDNEPVSKSRIVKTVGFQDGRVILEVGSGIYDFGVSE